MRTTQTDGKFNLYPGIRTRITFPFLIAIALTAILGVFVVTRLVAGSVQERFNNQLLDSAQAASNAVAEIERQQLATLRSMVFTEGMANAVDEGNDQNLDTWLRPIAINANIDDVIVFDENGQGIYRLSRIQNETGIQYDTLPPLDVADREGVQRILGQETDILGDKFVDVIQAAPETMFYISAPIVDGEGNFVGGMSVGISAAHLAERVSEQSLSGVTLLHGEGQVLSTTYRSVAPEALQLNSTESARLMNEAQTSSPIESIILDGTDYQVLYTPFQMRSQSIGLLAVSLPSNFIVERINTSRNVFALLFSGLFILIGLIGLLAARTITRPVSQLVETTRAIRGGDLSRRVGLHIPDELGELGSSFDDMTDQLIVRNQEINTLYLQQLEETARRQAVLTSITDAVIVQDFHKTILMRNRTAEALLANPALSSQIETHLQNPEAIEQGQIISLSEQFFSLVSTPVQMASGETLGYVVVFRDITALVEAERLKDELIKQMSHELRTPLGAARGYIELVPLLEAATLQEQTKGFIQNAVENLATLERMVNQVIDVSTLLSSQFTLNIERFNLGRVLEEKINVWLPKYQQRELTLNLQPPTEDVWIEGDPARLGEVLDHILRNAYSYTLPGGKIEAQVVKSDHQVKVMVQDTGVGIGADEIERVFERMYRGRSADAGPTDARGLGLGLYISKRIIEAHHGTIELKSELQKGTLVTVHLPPKQENQRD